MFRGKGSILQSSPLTKLPKMQVDGNETGNSPNSTIRRGAKSTSDPKSGPMLELLQLAEKALDPSPWKELEVEAIHNDQQDARPVKKALLKRQQAPNRITQHTHGLDRRHGLATIMAHVLTERETAVKIETQVPPIGPGDKAITTGKRSHPQIKEGVLVTLPLREVK